MRHRVYGKKLGRNKNEREALFRTLVQSLIISEKIETTDAKAKAIKGLIDKIINQAKSPTSRRLVSQFLVTKSVEEKLVKELLPRLKDRTSGYTSSVRLGRRQGDATMMVKVSLLLSDAKEKVKVKQEKKEVVKKTTATRKVKK